MVPPERDHGWNSPFREIGEILDGFCLKPPESGDIHCHFCVNSLSCLIQVFDAYITILVGKSFKHTIFDGKIIYLFLDASAPGHHIGAGPKARLKRSYWKKLGR